MNPRGSVAAVASGLSLALLAASLLPPFGHLTDRTSGQGIPDIRSSSAPPSENMWQDSTGQAETNRSSEHCKSLYPPGFFPQALIRSEKTQGRRCRPQLPTEQDCAAVNAWLRSSSGANTRCPPSGCSARSESRGQAGAEMPLRPEVKVVECDQRSGGQACWERLKRADGRSSPTRRCVLIYPSATSPNHTPPTTASPPPPSPIPPPIKGSSDNFTLRNASCSCPPMSAPLAVRRFVYAGGGAALSAALTAVRPLTLLTSRVDRALLYLACSPGAGRGDVTQRLLLVSPKRPGNKRKVGAYNIKVTLIPALSRAGFYRSFPRSQHVLQSVRRQAAVFDFPLYQATAAPNLSVSLAHFLSGILHRRSDDEQPSDSVGPFISGLSTWEEREASGPGATSRRPATGVSDEAQEEDAHFRLLEAKVSVVDHFLCAVVREVTAASGWLRRPVPSACAYDVTALHLALSAHVARKDLFPVSVSVLKHFEDLPHLSNQGNDADDLLASHIDSFKDSPVIHVICSMVGTLSLPYSMGSSYIVIEESNPLLFITIPNTIKQFIPEMALYYLDLNTNRLVTSGDIALTISTLANHAKSVNYNVSAGAVSERELNGTVTYPLAFTEVASSRTCDKVRTGSPHFCICADESAPAENDTIYVALADVAIATLNQMIIQQVSAVNQQRFPSFSHSPYGSCLKLFGAGFQDVRVRRQGNMILTEMSLIVTQKSALLKSHTFMETFDVTLQTHFHHNIESGVQRTVLINYKRTSAVELYSACADANVDLDLCLCLSGTQDFTYVPENLIHELRVRQFGTKARLVPLHQACLLLSIRHFGQSVSFSAANLCPDKTYRVSLRLFADHVITSRENPSSTLIGSLREAPLNVAMTWSYYQPMPQVGYRVFHQVIKDSSQ